MRDLVERHEPELAALALAEVGEDPFALVDEGTSYAQPAILCASLAGWTAAGRPSAAFFAGHSLGELSALAAAGSIASVDAVRMAVLRGRLMQDAAEAHPGGMLALLGDADLARAAATAGDTVVANDNGPTQLVVAGPPDALAATEAAAKADGLRTIELSVRGAFHTPAMKQAVEPFREALGEIEVSQPEAPVYSSVFADLFGATADRIRDQLAAALVRPVRWRETVEALHAIGVREFVDAGPGKTLARMIRRAFDDAETSMLAEREAARA
jgi:[acyl-carrier-protein] S-malonyltransferase